MDKHRALVLDIGRGVYCDSEPKTGSIGVFGTESGFCYATFDEPTEAAEYACDLHTSLLKRSYN